MSDLTKLNTAKLRKLAEEQKIEGWEDMEKKDLVEALQPKEKTEEKPEEKEVDLNELSLKELKKVAKEREVNVKGLKKKSEVIQVIEGINLPDKEETEEDEKKEEGLGIGITGGRTPIGSKAAIMKERLSKQKKVTILIPKDKNEKLGSTMPVVLNGFRLNIMKGVYVEVPDQVARIIMKSQKQTIQALRGETVNPQSGEKKDSILDGNERELS